MRFFGQPLNEVLLDENAAFMQQQTVLFDDTVKANIAMGLFEDDIERYLAKEKIALDDAPVKEACLTAQLWHDVPTLGAGRGLEAPAGYRGKFISGGLAQRVCLARCLIRRTPILFLDEPVSAQDERMVHDLSEELGGLTYPVRTRNGEVVEGAPERPVTVVSSTHNASLLKHFTHAAMMLHGRVVEFGTTEDLLKRKGHYYRMIMSRTGLSVDSRGNGRCTPERLKQVWLFASAPDAALQELAKKFKTRICVNDDVIYEKGNDADAMYFLVSGQIEAKEDTDEEDGVSTGKRFVYMAGEDFGVEGLLDKTFRWDMTAKVCSRKATLLELGQDDFEEMLAANPLLAESAGRILADVNRLREPKSLGLLWPFYGAPAASLEAVSMAMEPSVAFAGSALCQPPMDPCQELVMVVAGSIELRRAPGPGSAEGMTTQLANSGSTFGEFEMLPAPKPGSPEEIILSQQRPVVVAKAIDFTVLLQLTRAKLEALMDRDEALRAAYQHNLGRWMRAVRSVRLRRHWFFCMCPPELLTLLSPIWTISAVAEGTALIDVDSARGGGGDYGEADSCVLVLDGSVEVQTQRAVAGEKETTTVGADAVVNATALVGSCFDHSLSDAFALGEVVSRAEVWDESNETFTTALVLTLSTADFLAAVETTERLQLASGKLAGLGLIERLRRLAKARATLLTSSGIRETRAMPEMLEEVHLRQLAREATTLALEDPDDALFKSEERACVYIVLAGELHVRTVGGESRTLRPNDALSSPTPPELAVLPSVTLQCVSAHAASAAGCVAIRYDVFTVLNDLQSAHNAEERKRQSEDAARERQRAREELKNQINALLREVKQLEVHLGLQQRKSPRERWAWAIKRVRLLVKWGGGANGANAASGGGAAATKADAVNAPMRQREAAVSGGLEAKLRDLQRRKKQLDELAKERQERLRHATEAWDALQPAVLPAESSIRLDRRPLLALAHVEAAEQALEKLTAMRKAERAKLLKQLEGLDAETNAASLRHAKGIDHASLTKLAATCLEHSGALAGPMATVQARLEELRRELCIPKDAVGAGGAQQGGGGRGAGGVKGGVHSLIYEWTPGMPIEPGQIEACEAEVARLERAAELVRGFMLEAESDRVLCGEVIGGMLAMMEAEREKLSVEEQARLREVRAEHARAVEGKTHEQQEAKKQMQMARSAELHEEQKRRKAEQAEHAAHIQQLQQERAAEVETLRTKLAKAEEAVQLAEIVTGKDLDGDGDVGEIGDARAPAAAGTSQAAGGAASAEATAAVSAARWGAELQAAQKEIARLNILLEIQTAAGAPSGAAPAATGTKQERRSSKESSKQERAAAADEKTAERSDAQAKKAGKDPAAGAEPKEESQAPKKPAPLAKKKTEKLSAGSQQQQQQPPPPAPAPLEKQFTYNAKIDLDEGPDAPPISQQLASSLRKNATRVVDLFRKWDVDSSGGVTRKEFHRAMSHLGLEVPKESIDELFDEWDQNGNNLLKLGELQRTLMSAALQDKKESSAAKAAKAKAWAAEQRQRKAAATAKAARQTAGEEDEQRAAAARLAQSLGLGAGSSGSTDDYEGEDTTPIARDEDVELMVDLRDTELSKTSMAFEMLAAGEGGMVGAFIEQYGREVNPPGVATERDLRQLYAETVEMQQALGRLRERADRDGLIRHVRALMSRQQWESSTLAKKLDGLERKQSQKADGKVSLENLRGFLGKHRLKFSEASLDFWLQAAGTSLAECEEGKSVDVGQLAHAVDTVPEEPLYMTIMPAEELEQRADKSWRRHRQKIRSVMKLSPGALDRLRRMPMSSSSTET